MEYNTCLQLYEYYTLPESELYPCSKLNSKIYYMKSTVLLRNTIFLQGFIYNFALILLKCGLNRFYK